MQKFQGSRKKDGRMGEEKRTIIMMHHNIICKIWNSLTIHFMRRINIAVIMLFDVATGPKTTTDMGWALISQTPNDAVQKAQKAKSCKM